jgi:hypothetical protein
MQQLLRSCHQAHRCTQAAGRYQAASSDSCGHSMPAFSPAMPVYQCKEHTAVLMAPVVTERTSSRRTCHAHDCQIAKWRPTSHRAPSQTCDTQGNQAEARVAFCITPDALPDLGVGAVYRQRHEYGLQAQTCQLSPGYVAVHRVEEGVVCSQPIEVAVDGPRPQQPWEQFVELPAAAQLLFLS